MNHILEIEFFNGGCLPIKTKYARLDPDVADVEVPKDAKQIIIRIYEQIENEY